MEAGSGGTSNLFYINCAQADARTFRTFKDDMKSHTIWQPAGLSPFDGRLKAALSHTGCIAGNRAFKMIEQHDAKRRIFAQAIRIDVKARIFDAQRSGDEFSGDLGEW
ncbi:MAG: hypothetical protein QE570_12320 [Verrucomicrobiota bacterium]|nr:hypothetical protein [Verrucomicrobiota bacterium]